MKSNLNQRGPQGQKIGAWGVNVFIDTKTVVDHRGFFVEDIQEGENLFKTPSL